jgi:hypothetical protein
MTSLVDADVRVRQVFLGARTSNRLLLENNIKTALRIFLKQILSVRAFEAILYRWWCISFFIPRAVTSWVVRHIPECHDLGVGGASQVSKQLQKVNVSAPTKMCRVMTKCGSDKGNGWHNYTTLYSALFGRSSESILANI